MLAKGRVGPVAVRGPQPHNPLPAGGLAGKLGQGLGRDVQHPPRGERVEGVGERVLRVPRNKEEAKVTGVLLYCVNAFFFEPHRSKSL